MTVPRSVKAVIAVVLIAAAAILLVWLFRAPSAGPRTATPGKLKVVATNYPMYIFTLNVAGDDADVTNLLPSGVGPHEYSPTPADARSIAKADVVVENGLGLENWLDGMMSSVGSKALVVVASQGLATSTPEGVDPHVWVDPVMVQGMAANIADGLAKADPAHAAAYRQRAAEYGVRLAALDSEYRQAFTGFARRDFIAFHSAFGYLAKRYGLNQVAVIEEFPGKEPTAQYLASVVDTIRRDKVTAIFSEPQFSPKVVETVAQETGLKVRALDTAETGAASPDAYEKIMRANLATLVDAFKEENLK